MRTYIFFFLCSMFGSMMLTPIVRIFALKLGYVDKTSTRKVHDQPIPHIGGAAIFIAFLIPFGGFLIYQNYYSRVLLENIPEIFGIIMGALIVFLMGAFDDIKGTRARYKFMVEVLAACLVYYAGVRINILANPFGAEPFHFGHIVGLPFTVVWIVGVTNAVNFSDGIDGLAAGMSIFVALILSIVSLINGHLLIALLSITLAGSTAGFLVFNFPPAKIFMGDSGALFLGFMLGSISILGSMKSTAAVALIIPIMVMIVPLSDTLMAMARRILKGRGVAEADQDHVHHRLLKKGLSHRQIIAILYGVTAFFGLVGLVMIYTSRRENAVVLGAVGLLGIILVRRLGYKEFKVGKIPDTIRESQQERKRTREEREVIKEFEKKAGKLTAPVIWEKLLETVKELGYSAIEITPERGTSLFKKMTGSSKKGSQSVVRSPQSVVKRKKEEEQTENKKIQSVEREGKRETGTEGVSLFWKSPDLELDVIKIDWYLEIPIFMSTEKKVAEIKVYKDEMSLSQKIHDEVILELLCEVVGDCFN